MLSKLGPWVIHFIGAALACGQLAYWSIRLMTPPPAAAPAPVRAATGHDLDPILLARAFGQIERAAPAAIANIQVGGVFAAGPDSAAVFIVGDRPAKAVRLGQEVAPGYTLVEVDPQSVTLDSAGVRHQLRVPSLPGAASPGATAALNAGFERRGNVLTAPSVEVASTPHPTGGRPAAGMLTPRNEPALAPQPGQAPPAIMPPATRREVPGRPTGQ